MADNNALINTQMSQSDLAMESCNNRQQNNCDNEINEKM